MVFAPEYVLAKVYERKDLKAATQTTATQLLALTAPAVLFIVHKRF